MLEQLIDSLTKEQFINNAVAFALKRNPILEVVDQQRVYRLTERAALEIADFERLIQKHPLGERVPQTPEQAKRIIAIWCLSAVGTYLKEFQDDRWKDMGIPWMGWTDRRRLNDSAALVRRLTNVISGQSYPYLSSNRKLTSDQVAALRSDIAECGPYLIYGSTAEQNEHVKRALAEPGVIIPSSKVHVIYFPGKPKGVNTVDQMNNFYLPTDLEVHQGDILAIVAHAPHLVRALHIMDKLRPLPEDLTILPYPLPSPFAAGTEYAKLEISGLLYYTLVEGKSSEQPYPNQIQFLG